MTSGRIENALWHAGFAMRLLPMMGGGWGALSGSVATVLLARLGPNERAFLATSAVQACDVEFQTEITRALAIDATQRGWAARDWEHHEWQRQKCADAAAKEKKERLKWGCPPRWVADGKLLGEIDVAIQKRRNGAATSGRNAAALDK